MRFDDAMKQLASADDDMPTDALRWCLINWDMVAPLLIDKLKRGADRDDISDDDRNIALFSIFMMAEAREARSFAPLCRLARNSKRVIDILSEDAVFDYLRQIFISTFDGDINRIIHLVRGDEVSDEVRCEALDALTWLAATGRVDRDKMVSWLRGLCLTLPFESPRDWLWSGWARSIALLGLEDMTPLVKAAFAEGRMDDIWIAPDRFDMLMNITCNDPERMAGFAQMNIRPFADIIGELSKWYCFSAKRKEDDRLDGDDGIESDT